MTIMVTPPSNPDPWLWGWEAASVAVTTAATLVALFVGVAPIVIARRQGKARAKVHTTVFLADVDVASFWLQVANGIIQRAPNDPIAFNSSLGFALNVRRIDFEPLLAEAQHLPRSLLDQVGKTAAKIKFYESSVCGADGQPILADAFTPSIPPPEDHIGQVLPSVLALQRECHAFVYGKPPPNVTGRADDAARRLWTIEAERHQPTPRG